MWSLIRYSFDLNLFMFTCWINVRFMCVCVYCVCIVCVTAVKDSLSLCVVFFVCVQNVFKFKLYVVYPPRKYANIVCFVAERDDDHPKNTRRRDKNATRRHLVCFGGLEGGPGGQRCALNHVACTDALCLLPHPLVHIIWIIIIYHIRYVRVLHNLLFVIFCFISVATELICCFVCACVCICLNVSSLVSNL